MCPLSEPFSFAQIRMLQLHVCFRLLLQIVTAKFVVKACELSCCRYYVTQEWVAKKLEALVDVSEQLDLEWLRGRGPHPDEHLQPEDAQPSANPASTAGSA